FLRAQRCCREGTVPRPRPVAVAMDTANQVRVEPSHRCANRNGCHLWKKKAAHGLLMGNLCAANVRLRPTPLSRGSFWLLCPSLLRISLSSPQAPWWSDVQHHEGRLSGLSYRLVSVPTLSGSPRNPEGPFGPHVGKEGNLQAYGSAKDQPSCRGALVRIPAQNHR